MTNNSTNIDKKKNPNSQNTKKRTTTYDAGNPGSGSRQIQQYVVGLNSLNDPNPRHLISPTAIHIKSNDRSMRRF